MKAYKLCKGINKAKDYPGCGQEVPSNTRKYGLCRTCFREWVKSTSEGFEWFRTNQIKPREEKERKRKESLNKAFAEKKKEESVKVLLRQVKQICHEYIRKRDEGKSCVSCGAPYNKDFQAGHYFKAELYSELKFDERNIHGQCRKCNIRLEGNVQEYTFGIQNRISYEDFVKINNIAKNSKKHSYKWDVQELKELKKYYRNKLKELK
jgi:hypothetical protein